MLSLYPKMRRDLPKHRCGLSIGPDKRVAWLPRGAPLTVCRETSAPRILDFGQYTTIRVVYANSNTVLKRTILAFDSGQGERAFAIHETGEVFERDQGRLYEKSGPK